MKAVNILLHPVLVLVIFYSLLISGESLGGFYAFYVLLALPHGGTNALLAIAGTIVLGISQVKFNRNSSKGIKAILDLTGVLLLYASLFSFFQRSWSVNYGTFQQTLPLVSFIVFGIITLLFLTRSIWNYVQNQLDTTNRFHV